MENGLDILSSKFKTASADEIEEIIEHLPETNNRKMIESLFTLITDDYLGLEFYEVIGKKLSKFGEPAFQFLIEKLGSQEWSNISFAALALKSFQNFDLIQPLIDRLTYPDKYIRANLADALGNSKNRDAIPSLTLLTKDQNGIVRLAAIMSIYTLDKNYPINFLVEALNDMDAYSRIRVILKLIELADDEAVPVLKPILNDEDLAIRLTLVDGIRAFPNYKFVPLLKLALKDEDSTVRQIATETLNKIGDKNSLS